MIGRKQKRAVIYFRSVNSGSPTDRESLIPEYKRLRAEC